MTTSDDDRVGAHYMLRPKSKDNWQTFALHHRVTLTALIDTLGYSVGPLVDTPDEELPPILREALAAARELDLKRRLHSPVRTVSA